MIWHDLITTIIEFVMLTIVRVTRIFILLKDFFVNLPSFFSWVPNDIYTLFFLLLSTAVLLRLLKFI